MVDAVSAYSELSMFFYSVLFFSFLKIFFVVVVNHCGNLYWICHIIASVLCCHFFGYKTCGVWAPQPGIAPTPPALEGEVLTTWPLQKSLTALLIHVFSIVIGGISDRNLGILCYPFFVTNYQVQTVLPFFFWYKILLWIKFYYDEMLKFYVFICWILTYIHTYICVIQLYIKMESFSVIHF